MFFFSIDRYPITFSLRDTQLSGSDLAFPVYCSHAVSHFQLKLIGLDWAQDRATKPTPRPSSSSCLCFFAVFRPQSGFPLLEWEISRDKRLFRWKEQIVCFWSDCLLARSRFWCQLMMSCGISWGEDGIKALIKWDCWGFHVELLSRKSRTARQTDVQWKLTILLRWTRPQN